MQPDVPLLALLAGCFTLACGSEGLFGDYSDWFAGSIVHVQAGDNRLDMGMIAVNITESDPDSWLHYYYGDYDYELLSDHYCDGVQFTGAECVQFSLATQAGSTASPGAILVQEDIWVGANALDRQPEFLNFSNAPGAILASQCIDECSDINIRTDLELPYALVLMNDGDVKGSSDLYTLNLTAHGPNAPECANTSDASTSVTTTQAVAQWPQEAAESLTLMAYQELEQSQQPSSDSKNFTAWGQFLVQNASCVHYTLHLPGVPVAEREHYSLTLYNNVQFADAVFAHNTTPRYTMSSCTGATCNITASQWIRQYGLEQADSYWLISQYQWFVTTKVAKFFIFARVFLPEECQAQLEGQTEIAPAPLSNQTIGTSVGVANVSAESSPAQKAGPIAGGVVGGTAAVAGVSAAIFILLRRRQRQSPRSSDSEAPTSMTSGSQSMGSFAHSKRSGGWTSSGRSLGTGSPSKHSRSTSSSEEPWIIESASIQLRKGKDGVPQKLGQGGFGSVYLGVQDGVREVACKVLHSTGSSVREEKAFREEINRLAECRDRNVVQFYGAVLGAETMLVTEYCERGDLFNALADGTDTCLWYQRGQTIALDIARGLHALHSRRIVHLDVKSPNILLTQSYQAKIADVGMSYQLFSHTHASDVSNRGTWAWQSPEILLGRGAGTAADVWSYGVVLYEILSGEKPRRGRLRQISVPEEGPSQAEQLMEACLLDNPADRPTMKEVIERLRLFVLTSS